MGNRLHGQARSHRSGTDAAYTKILVGAGLRAMNDNPVYLPVIRHKYQEATVRYGRHAKPISTICLRVG